MTEGLSESRRSGKNPSGAIRSRIREPLIPVRMTRFYFSSPTFALTPFPQWHPEISHFTPQTPLLLIGTKIDTRHNPTELSLMRTQGLAPITAEEGAQVAREIGAKGYVECSAMTGEGVERVFEEAWRVCAKTGGLKRRAERERRKCVVL